VVVDEVGGGEQEHLAHHVRGLLIFDEAKSRSLPARAVSAVHKPWGLRVSEHRRDEQPYPLPNPLSAQHR
jgi:hypothetical protein